MAGGEGSRRNVDILEMKLEMSKGSEDIKSHSCCIHKLL